MIMLSMYVSISMVSCCYHRWSGCFMCMIRYVRSPWESDWCNFSVNYWSFNFCAGWLFSFFFFSYVFRFHFEPLILTVLVSQLFLHCRWFFWERCTVFTSSIVNSCLYRIVSSFIRTVTYDQTWHIPYVWDYILSFVIKACNFWFLIFLGQTFSKPRKVSRLVFVLTFFKT